MSRPYRLPQWPPRSSAPEDLLLHFKPHRRRGDHKDNGSDPSHHHLLDEDATTLVTDDRADTRQQQQRCRPAEDLADESFLGVPIFRGDVVVVEAEQDGGGTCINSNLELSLLDDDHAAEAPTTMPGGERASPRWNSSNRAEQQVTSTTEPVVSAGPGVSSSTPPLRVRFAPAVADGGTAVREAAEASPSPLPPAAVEGHRGDENAHVSASGSSSFVRHRNGMHTAWRRKAAAVPDNPRLPLQAIVVAAAAESPNGGVRRNSNTTSRREPLAPIGKGGVMSADQLIAQSMSSPQQQQQQQQQQQPVRLFLRRSRPPVSPEPAGKENGRAAAVLRDNKGSAPGARRVSGSQQAFPLPWGGTHSPVSAGVQLNRARGGADGGGWGDREALLEVLTTPPPPRARPRSAQHAARSPPQMTTPTTRTSPGFSIRKPVVVADDENTPPPRRRTPSMPAAGAAPLSSVAIRQNLARVARTSKVGTKADPVHLYRQRQELEQARTKKAAAVARSRRKPTSREGRRTAGGFSALGTGTAAAGGWVGVGGGRMSGGGRVGLR
ncbi:unnamed protein product [Ectocarpus fasciculatus]